MAGYQAWFRCPADDAGVGWRHWSESKTKIDPSTIHPDFWPDMSAYGSIKKYAAPGSTDADGNPSYCYSACDPAVVRLHFEWMRDYDIDGIWLQRFVVSLPGQPGAAVAPSQEKIMQAVIEAAQATGRVWAISYDLAGAQGTPADVLNAVWEDWRKLVDEGIVTGPRYLRHNGKPVVNIWDFIQDSRRPIDPRQINRFIEAFRAPGMYRAFLVSGGTWNWHRYPAEWQECTTKFDAYIPWNIGNTSLNEKHETRASTAWWAKDKKYFEDQGVLWIPTIYPGFSWNHLTKITDPAQSSTRPRRGGQFYWEQWLALKKLNVQTIFIAMFDEVDEGTAIDKNTNAPPAFYLGKPLGIMPFQTYEGMPSDWYLRLTRAGRKLLRGELEITTQIPIKP